MTFHSLKFAAFFLTFIVIYWRLPKAGWRKVWLLAACFAFYAFFSWQYLLVLLATTAFNFHIGSRIADAKDTGASRRWLITALVWNFGLLIILKYLAGPRLPAGAEVIIPLGISFYTFQIVSYSLDIYQKKIRPVSSYLDFSLFCAFFPTIVAGPIERARHLLPQIERCEPPDRKKIDEGAWLFFSGLVKKILIADNLAVATSAVFAMPGSSSGMALWLSLYLFTFQIYADFSGYSDMARGLARWMGFEINPNFRFPLFASNVTKLWQGWHITLTEWMKEYVFYPMGVFRSDKGRAVPTVLVVLITWGLIGLWHGAAGIFVLWGVYHSVWIVVYHKMLPWLNRTDPRLRGPLGWFVTFHLFMLGLLAFALRSVPELFLVLQGMISLRAAGATQSINYDLLGLVSVWIAGWMVIEWLQYRKEDEFVVFSWPAWVRAGIYIVGFYWIVFFGAFRAEQYFYCRF